MKVSGCHLPEQFVWVLYKRALEASGSCEKKQTRPKIKRKKQTKEQSPPKFLVADHIFTDFLSERGSNEATEEIIVSLSSMSLEVS